jgi:hypothetical protein
MSDNQNPAPEVQSGTPNLNIETQVKFTKEQMAEARNPAGELEIEDWFTKEQMAEARNPAGELEIEDWFTEEQMAEARNPAGELEIEDWFITYHVSRGCNLTGLNKVLGLLVSDSLVSFTNHSRKASNNDSKAIDVDGEVYRLKGKPFDANQKEVYDFLLSDFSLVTEGFYDEELAKKIPAAKQARRAHIKPAEGLPAGIDHRRFHFTHFRIEHDSKIFPRDLFKYKAPPSLIDFQKLDGQHEFSSKGGICLCYELRPIQHEGKEMIEVLMGVSVCNMTDLYSRKFGANQALARLLEMAKPGHEGHHDFLTGTYPELNFTGSGVIHIPADGLSLRQINGGHWELEGKAWPQQIMLGKNLLSAMYGHLLTHLPVEKALHGTVTINNVIRSAEAQLENEMFEVGSKLPSTEDINAWVKLSASWSSFYVGNYTLQRSLPRDNIEDYNVMSHYFENLLSYARDSQSQVFEGIMGIRAVNVFHKTKFETKLTPEVERVAGQATEFVTGVSVEETKLLPETIMTAEQAEEFLVGVMTEKTKLD